MIERVRYMTTGQHERLRAVSGQAVPRRTQLAALWEPRYRTLVVVTDSATTVTVVVSLALLLLGQHVRSYQNYATAVSLVTATVVAVIGSLSLAHAWHPKFLGQGAEEFGRLGRALLGSTVTLALGILAVSPSAGRVWVFTALPALALVLFPQRYLLRKWLHRKRSLGSCMLPVLAAGHVTSVRDLIGRTRSAPHLGWHVAAACTTRQTAGDATEIDGVPIVGEPDDLAALVRHGGYRIVAVTPDQHWTPDRLQRLAWSLEGTGAEMVVASGLMEVAGPRVHVSGVLGMPMLWVSEPVFTGASRMIKACMDRVGAGVLLVLFAPALLPVAALISLGSRGPVFYRQWRVGRNGTEFMIVKFRTMVVGADSLRESLAGANEAAGPLFKLRGDPRVTRAGAMLRRYSLDELPQLINVLCGQMSLVGPRPPLPSETASYEPHLRRKLLVKPGLTGLWQVSGRSDLTWHEAVRLDLRYVEDWSLALDLMILWKTLRAVLSGRGAY